MELEALIRVFIFSVLGWNDVDGGAGETPRIDVTVCFDSLSTLSLSLRRVAHVVTHSSVASSLTLPSYVGQVAD